MEKIFNGDLKRIDPQKLITGDKYNKTEGFFLGLGSVYNDLKGLMLFQIMLIETYKKPENGEVSDHAGNYYGTIVQIKKLIAGTINEFFILLEKNKDVFDETEFKQILDRLSGKDKQLWEGLIAASQGRLSTATDLMDAILKIRNNIAFHYYQSGKILRKAYLSRFFGKMKNASNEFAYYSLGKSLETTRFYFSDAAVEESLYIMAGKEPEEIIMGDQLLQKYQEQIIETIKVINVAIASLLKNYIQSRRNQSH